jgi:hypothetical protein
LQRNDCIEYAKPFCFSLTKSPTSILNGCIAILIDVSRNISIINPKSIADDTLKPKDPALGRKHITIIATKAPTNK